MEYKKSLFNICEKNEKGRIIYNSFTKAVAIVEDVVYEKYLSNEFDLIDKHILNEMIEMGFILKNDLDEFFLIQEKYNRIRNSKEWLFITLLPTMNCNFKCPYCFEGQEARKVFPEMNFEVLKNFAEKNFVNRKHIHISLFGGEPLLKLRELKEFYEYVSVLSEQHRFTFTSGITTNGYLLSDKTSELLVQNFRTRNFQITIDGYEESHNKTRAHISGENTYKCIIKNFKVLLLKNKKLNNILNIVLRINILNNSVCEIKTLLDAFSESEKKLFEIYFRPIYNTKNFKASNDIDLEDYYQLANSMDFTIRFKSDVSFCHCEGDGGSNQIHIMPDMSIWKCINDLECQSAKLGNIDFKGNMSINESTLEKWMEVSPFEDEMCKSCKMLPICWGGCPLQYSKDKKRNCIYEKGFSLKSFGYKV